MRSCTRLSLTIHPHPVPPAAPSCTGHWDRVDHRFHSSSNWRYGGPRDGSLHCLLLLSIWRPESLHTGADGTFPSVILSDDDLMHLFQLFNVAIDAVIGIIPLIGDALDIAFKSNVRNLRLLESHLSKRKGFAVDLAPTYEEEFNNVPPATARARAAPPPPGGVNWSALMDLANMFAIGGGGSSRR